MHLPVIVYARKALTRRQASDLRRLSSTMLIDTVKSLELLLYKSTLLLHRNPSVLPAPSQALIEQTELADPEIAGKKVLIVDDDARNVFALASLLEHHHLEVVYAESGQAAIDMLHQQAGIDLVLMDVMMPEIDGYETMRRIRAEERFKSLPIIALTAKAMKGDRELCMQAGASDYIAKPVANEQLLSMLRVWASA
jgi:CheY-like chemotaxis protein